KRLKKNKNSTFPKKMNGLGRWPKDVSWDWMYSPPPDMTRLFDLLSLHRLLPQFPSLLPPKFLRPTTAKKRTASSPPFPFFHPSLLCSPNPIKRKNHRKGLLLSTHFPLFMENLSTST